MTKNSAATRALRQAEIEAKNVRKRASKLLQRARLDLKGYRKELTTLQKQGVISKRITPLKHIPTRYMVAKLKKFKSVAVGHELAVPIKKLSAHTQRTYLERGLAQRIGNFFVIPKTAEKQRADIHKGHIRVTTQLDRGDEQVIKIPARMEDLNNFLQWADDNETLLNNLKGPRDQFGFQLFGHNAKIGFPNIQALIAHLNKYNHILGNHRASKQAIQEFVLIRFRPSKRGPVHPSIEPYFGEKKYSNKRKKGRKEERRNDENRREKERKRKARYRMQEGIADHKARIERQRKYDRERANYRREERMSKRLMGD
jgi:hypothetical protein